MAKEAYVGSDGLARRVTAVYVGAVGAARAVKRAYVGEGGVARLFWEAPQGTSAFQAAQSAPADGEGLPAGEGAP